MDIFDPDSLHCFFRLGLGFWFSTIAVVVAVVCAMVGRGRKAIVAAGLAVVFGAGLVFQWEGVALQWQLGLLDSESPQANERAYAMLKGRLASAQIWQIVRNEREVPNVRFALALMLHERGEEALLQSASVAPLQRPVFFGSSQPQGAACKLSFPLEVRQLSQRLVDFPSPVLRRANDPFEKFREFARTQGRELRNTGETR